MAERHRLDRRDFLRILGCVGGAALSPAVLAACSSSVRDAPPSPSPQAQPSPTGAAAEKTSATPSPVPPTPEPARARVALVRTDDRAAGVQRAIDLLERNPVSGKQVFLKPNFNSADPTPGSTHPDTLQALVRRLQAMGADRIRVGDRSGMGDTGAVMRQLGVFRMGEELGFEALTFDALPASGWVPFSGEGSHWGRGFALAGPILEAEAVVQTCCLKTHRFGGHFTLSLKNSVGMAAKLVPGEGYNYMNELHNSPHQRRMIAEINQAYSPELILLDGLQAFVNGGPDRGRLVEPGVMLAGSDRVAIDAVGVALLRMYGTTPQVSQGPIFQQEQIARAVELGLGVESPDQIELVTADPESQAVADRLGEFLYAH